MLLNHTVQACQGLWMLCASRSLGLRIFNMGFQFDPVLSVTWSGASSIADSCVCGVPPRRMCDMVMWLSWEWKCLVLGCCVAPLALQTLPSAGPLAQYSEPVTFSLDLETGAVDFQLGC